MVKGQVRGEQGEYWVLLDKSMLNPSIESVPLCILHRPDSSSPLAAEPLLPTTT